MNNVVELPISDIHLKEFIEDFEKTVGGVNEIFNTTNVD